MGLLSLYDEGPFPDPTQGPGSGPDSTYQGTPAAPAIPAGPIAPTTTPPGALAGSDSGGYGFGGSGSSGFNFGKPSFDFRDVPVFTPPEFVAPTFADALNEPGYQFRSQAGLDAIEGSAAARGILRTGGTLKDLGTWNQNFASQEYGNVFNRALSAYDRTYRGAHDAYAPKLAEWQTLSNAEMQAVLAQYGMQWEQYKWDNPHAGGGGGYGDEFEYDPGQIGTMPVGLPAGYLQEQYP